MVNKKTSMKGLGKIKIELILKYLQRWMKYMRFKNTHFMLYDVLYTHTHTHTHTHLHRNTQTQFCFQGPKIRDQIMN